MNKSTISTILASAVLAIASSARKTSGNKNQGVAIKTIDELYRYANDPQLAKTVTKVFLSENQITEIPKEIGNLTNLERLYLDNNQITEIPKEIGSLIKLERLYLNYNQITEIPKEIGNLINLERLIIYNNQITEIPKEIRNLKNLEYLDIFNNQIQSPTRELLLNVWIPSGFSPKVAKLLFQILPSQQTSIRRY